ncbi:MAG: hypothetical protein ACKVKO_04945 [Acidimicrobiales bacterium]
MVDRPLRGKWALGIEPRNFTWILKDRFAICERPGGFGTNHRRVRRQEEIIWLQQNHFDHVISLLNANHNILAYEEQKMPYHHWPLATGDDVGPRLEEVFGGIKKLLTHGEQIIIHGNEMNDLMTGFVCAYLVWDRLVPEVTEAVTVVERMLERKMGPDARAMVGLCEPRPEPWVSTDG